MVKRREAESSAVRAVLPWRTRVGNARCCYPYRWWPFGFISLMEHGSTAPHANGSC